MPAPTAVRTAPGDCPPARSPGGSVVGDTAARDHHHMTLARIRRALSNLVAEDRPGFKRLDASAARYDDGAWLTR
jgi:hypothetical protein